MIHDPTLIPDWYEDASCASIGGDVFFPAPSDDHRPARAICAGCDVRAQCLEYALTDPRLQGIWAGTTQQQRGRIRAKRRAS